VTDQGSQSRLACARMQAPAQELVFHRPPQRGSDDAAPLLRCWRCGRPGEWLELWAGRSDDP
jgi:hypothetical protein